jgi:REP element-mobilizing transposase RayT
MITIRAKNCYTPLARLSGDLSSQIETKLSKSGSAIDTELKALASHNPEIILYRYVIMPDHIHFIIRVTKTLERGLSGVISAFMGRCSRRYWAFNPEDECSKEKIGLFEHGFHDRILFHDNQFDAIMKYVADNPRRLLIRRSHSEYFNNVITIKIEEKLHAAYGNILLLRNPLKMAVVVSSKYTEEQLKTLHRQWAETSRQGGVLIGAFISKAEQDVKEAGIRAGASIIEIQPNGFTERYSPGPKNLEICAHGRLLEIGFHPYNTRSEAFDRTLCLEMNEFARRLAQISPDDILRVKK